MPNLKERVKRLEATLNTSGNECRASIEETCRWVAKVLAQPVTKISADLEIEDDGTETGRWLREMRGQKA